MQPSTAWNLWGNYLASSAQSFFELDPNKAEQGTNFEENAQRIGELTQKVLDAIINSKSSCPWALKEICFHFRENVKDKFPDFWPKAVGSFIFLRFFCAACVAPESFKLVKDSPSSQARRILVLVAKVIQNTANGIGKSEN